MKKLFIPFALFALVLVLLFVPADTEAAEGGSNKYFGSAIGVTRDRLLQSLYNNASKYLGSRYIASDYENDLIWANGVPRGDGYVGMNCAGWVARAFMDAGANLNPLRQYNDSGSMGVAGASTWASYALKTNLKYYTYATKEEMLADGKLRKGDIVYTMPREWFRGADTHLCIFWGDNPYDDKTWHQIGQGNCITPLREGCANSQWFVFPLDGGEGQLVYLNNEWVYVRGGAIDYSFWGLVPYANRWFYVKAGKIDWAYCNLVSYYGSWYYVRNGAIDWSYNSLAQVDGKGKYYKVKNGVVDFGFKGLYQYNGIWYYLKNGSVDGSYHGLVQGSDKNWYYINGGYVDWYYTGLVPSNSNWFYVDHGKVNWSVNTLCRNQSDWWKITNGMVDFKFNGLVLYNDSLYYLKNGSIDMNYRGLATAADGKTYFVSGGYVDRNLTGQVDCDGQIIYVSNGEVVDAPVVDSGQEPSDQ